LELQGISLSYLDDDFQGFFGLTHLLLQLLDCHFYETGKNKNKYFRKRVQENIKIKYKLNWIIT